jgi:glycosyltransferase AglD
MISETVSVVIPVYNDVEALKKVIPILINYLNINAPNYEIIIAEDASIDGSYEYAKESALNYDHVVHIHREKRMGRGSALSTVVHIAKGDIFCYFDVDLATDLNYLEPLLQIIENGSDIATGSRLDTKSTITRSISREIKSRGYNLFVRMILGSNLHDHQCGFKAFRRFSLIPLISETQDKHWFWDTEILIRAQKKGLKIEEIPITWNEGKGTTVKVLDTFYMGYAIINLWWQMVHSG